MTRGRPFPPGNKMGRGRPKGSPNKKTLLAQELFEQNSAALMALAINRSREDNQLLKMLVGRIVVRSRGLATVTPSNVSPAPLLDGTIP